MLIKIGSLNFIDPRESYRVQNKKNKIMNQQIKTLAIAAALTFGITTSSIYAQSTAQNNPHQKEFKMKSPEERAQSYVQMLTQKLSLTPDQQKKIQDAKLNEFTQKQELFKKQMELRKQTLQNIESTLTPEQLKTFNEERNKMKGQMKNRVSNNKGKYPYRGQKLDQPSDSQQ